MGTLTVVKQLKAQAEQKGLALRVTIPAEAVVRSDQEQIALVLQNLAGNAIKYSHHGTVRVEGKSWQIGDGKPGGWELAVADDGPGIAPDQQRRLFEAFERGNTHGQSGSGLGLAITSQAAKLLGAGLFVESTSGEGSIFRLVLPAVPGQHDESGSYSEGGHRPHRVPRDGCPAAFFAVLRSSLFMAVFAVVSSVARRLLG